MHIYKNEGLSLLLSLRTHTHTHIWMLVCVYVCISSTLLVENKEIFVLFLFNFLSFLESVFYWWYTVTDVFFEISQKKKKRFQPLSSYSGNKTVFNKSRFFVFSSVLFWYFWRYILNLIFFLSCQVVCSRILSFHFYHYIFF